MKSLLLLAIVILSASLSYGQQTVARTNELTNVVTENYQVLKANKKVKQGEYIASYKTTTIARGNYNNGKRVGEWKFYNPTGKMVQVYNYDKNQFSYLDTVDARHGLKYFVDGHTLDTDTITVPIKIGGSFYGMTMLIHNDRLLNIMRGNNPGHAVLNYKHVFTVSDDGALLRHQVLVKLGDEEKSYNLDESGIDADLTRFVPATINHKPAASQVTAISITTVYHTIM
jgi:hypothetical protein